MYLVEIADVACFATFIVGVFDILAHVFPAEEVLETGHFCFIVAD